MVRAVAVTLLFVWGIFIGLSLGGLLFLGDESIPPILTLKEKPQDKPREIIVPVPVNFTNLSNVKINVPAVDQDGKGVSTVLSVQLIPGKGRSLANIDNILFVVDTQNSIRTAKHVAEDITGVTLKNFDIVYTVEAEASVIEGPSAGAALAIATVAVIQNKQLDPDVMITGTVNEDGQIGPVGGILEKAKAAKDIGAEIFLVPTRQGSTSTFETKRFCETQGGTEVCTVEQVPVKTNIGEEAGIEVIEVKSIQEALDYFLE